jgi:hypothetical protein
MSPFSAVCFGAALALILIIEGVTLHRRKRKEEEKWARYRAEWALRREAWRNRSK